MTDISFVRDQMLPPTLPPAKASRQSRRDAPDQTPLVTQGVPPQIR